MTTKKKILLYIVLAAVLITGAAALAYMLRPVKSAKAQEDVFDTGPITKFMRMTVEEITDEYVEGTVYLICNEDGPHSRKIPFEIGQKIKLKYGKLVSYPSDITAEEINDMEKASVEIFGPYLSDPDLVVEGCTAYAIEIVYDQADERPDSFWDSWAELAEKNDGWFFYDTDIRY